MLSLSCQQVLGQSQLINGKLSVAIFSLPLTKGTQKKTWKTSHGPEHGGRELLRAALQLHNARRP